MSVSSFSYILGPCSAESEEQLREVAKSISSIENLVAMRAGVWKPRTRPNCFEGYGEKALQWMKNVKEETRVKIITEVAFPEHVEQCLQYGFDALWIGARTSGNPFSVQEIAESLRGVDIPIFIKNPPSPDLPLWMGAMERFQKVGIKKISAIHRGFSMYKSEPFRNMPIWEIPIELKRQCPDIAVFCDPSHICGNRQLIQNVSRTAAKLEMDGLMLEVHPTPSFALSDAEQQLNFKELFEILTDPVLLYGGDSQEALMDLLYQSRQEIDRVDEEILVLLKKRMDIVKKVGQTKQEAHLSVLQMDRWQEVMKERLEIAKKKGLDPGFIKELMRCIHTEALRQQNV